MHKEFISIKDALIQDPKLKKIRYIIKTNDVVINFPKIFPKFIHNVTAIKVEKKRLFLKIENSIWRSELKFKEQQIISKINKHFNEEIIKWIKFIH